MGDPLDLQEVQENNNLQMQESFWDAFTVPDRSPLWEWAQNNNVILPHSVRSQDFDIGITPWLRDPATSITDGITEEVTIIGAVQGAKSTIGEVALNYWASNDPGPTMYNCQTNEDAWEAAEDRVLPMMKASATTKTLCESWDLSKKKLTAPGWYILFQGAHARTNLQSKSIRYLVNEEPWMYPSGNLTEAYKRVTATWNSFVLNLSTGGIQGDELSGKISDATKWEYNCKCPKCEKLFRPKWSASADPKIPGGIRYDKSLIKEDGTWDPQAMRDSIYYECPNKKCKAKIKDTPSNRRFMSDNGRYVRVQKGIPEKHFYTYNGIVVTWVRFYDMVEEWLKALRAVRLGDETLLKEFVMKRLAEFWDPDVHRPVVSSVKVNNKIKLNTRLKNADYRAMTVDTQHDHFWVVIRDWKRDERSRLIHYERAETKEEVENLRIAYSVEPQFVMIDSAHFTSRVYRMCSEYNYTAVRGSDKKSFLHFIDHGTYKEKVQRIYSPLQEVDPWIGTKDAGTQTAMLLHFSKFEARERLFALRRGEVEGFEYEVPHDVGQDYHTQMDSEEKRFRQHSRTGETLEEYVQIRKHNHILDCEVFQVVLASITGLIGTEAMEAEMENASQK